MEQDKNSPMGAQSWERIAAGVAAAVVLLLVTYLVIRNQPFVDPNLVILTRIVLSLSVAVFGATVPGFLNVGWSFKGTAIRAGGALALFVLSFVFTPTVIQTPSNADDSSQENYNQGTIEYNLGHYTEAVNYLSRVQSNSKLYRSASRLKGCAFYQLGRYDEALTAFEETNRASSNRLQRLQADYSIGLTYFASKNYREAKDKLVPLASATEMQNDPGVIYNAAAILDTLGELNAAKSIFVRFPLSAALPLDASSRDVFARAHWLNACLIIKSGNPNCVKVNKEVTAAMNISPYLKDEIEKDTTLDVCR